MYTPLKQQTNICALSSDNQADNAFICAWPSQFKTAEACEFDTFDLARARDLYNSAAAGGHAGAQLRLAEAYENGEFDLAIDLKEARTWYQTAANGGDSHAQRRLGWAYEKGSASWAWRSTSWRRSRASRTRRRVVITKHNVDSDSPTRTATWV